MFQEYEEVLQGQMLLEDVSRIKRRLGYHRRSVTRYDAPFLEVPIVEAQLDATVDAVYHNHY